MNTTGFSNWLKKADQGDQIVFVPNRGETSGRLTATADRQGVKIRTTVITCVTPPPKGEDVLGAQRGFMVTVLEGAK